MRVISSLVSTRNDTCWCGRAAESSWLWGDMHVCVQQFSGQVSSAKHRRFVSARLQFRCYCQLSHADSGTECRMWSSQPTGCLSCGHWPVPSVRYLAWYVRVLGYSQQPLHCNEYSWQWYREITRLLYCSVLIAECTPLATETVIYVYTKAKSCTKGETWVAIKITRERDEIPKRDLTYHLTCLLIYRWTTTHLLWHLYS